MLLNGLDTLGVERDTALEVIEAVAMDSVPPIRRKAYEYLIALEGDSAETPEIAKALALPTNTVRRALEDLTAYALIQRFGQGQGKSDLWQVRP
jgi:predicted ArsR family transcriptional regulator